MKRIALRSHELAVETAHGHLGMVAMRELIEFLIALYGHHDPDGLAGTLYVVHRINGHPTSAMDQCVSGPAPVLEREIHRVSIADAQTTVIDVKAGAFRVWRNAALDEDAASKVAIVYRFLARDEAFVINGSDYPLDKPAPSYASNFARPRFSSLRDALIVYGRKLVRKSTCLILRGAWEDDSRLFFRPKPEHTMRDSLLQFLTSALVSAVTRPEQNVDDSHPVDLRVQWDFTVQEAIVEIKWLGASRAGGTITVNYSAARARSGAKQLADYLTKSGQSAPTRQTRGYLVVIDARRGALRKSTTSLERAKSMKYEHSEVTYKPEYHKLRDDFDAPLRLFAEPA